MGGQIYWRSKSCSKPRGITTHQEQLDDVLSMLALDRPIAAIARETGLTRQTVYRIQSDPAQDAAVLTAWERGQ